MLYKPHILSYECLSVDNKKILLHFHLKQVTNELILRLTLPGQALMAY